MVLSVLLHALLALPLLVGEFDLLQTESPPIWLNLDNQLGSPSERPETPPEPPKTENPPEAKATAPASAKKPKAPPSPKPRPKKRRAKPQKTSDVALTQLVPGDAALMLLLRMDRIRRSPYAKAVAQLLEVFYDYKTLLWSNTFDPVQHLDALLIATPNPYRVTQTFLAARYRIQTSRMQSVLEQSVAVAGRSMRWARRAIGMVGEIPSPPRLRHDPRIVVLRRRTVLLAHPRLQRELARRSETTEGTETSKESSPTSILQRLSRLQRQGGKGRRGAGMMLHAVNLPRLVRLPRDLPTPLELKLTIPAKNPAKSEAVARFKSPEQAARFFSAAKARVQRGRQSLMLRIMGVGSLLSKLHLQHKKQEVWAKLSLSAREVRRLLKFFGGMIPQIEVPGMAPRRNRDAGMGRDANGRKDQGG